MTTRITPEMQTSTMLQNINAALAKMDRTSAELSSGKSIQEPSDNPYGTSEVIDLQSQLEGLGAYATSAQDGVSWEDTASSAMASMNEVVERVRELLLKSANGTYNQSDLNVTALEVEKLTESIKQDADAQYGNQYVFSGTLTTTAPYQQGADDEYQGNGETISRAVAPGASVAISTNISSLLGNGEASGDGKLLDVLRTIAKNMRAGETSALGSTDLENLDANIETLSELQATAGSATDQLKAALASNEALQTSITEALSSVDEANVANTTIAYANEQAAYEAALRASATIVQESLLNFLQ